MRLKKATGMVDVIYFLEVGNCWHLKWCLNSMMSTEVLVSYGAVKHWMHESEIII